ncbi:MAG: hypothetical protein SFV53_03230 [Rickettsiales bacterium]|nr:hypothetical protein [Rickettsiales bacterium]
MKKRNIILLVIAGFFAIITFGIFQQIIGFNNEMIALQEMKKAEIETTKVEYGQCVVKIMETNQIAKAYKDDVMELAKKAGNNLEQFNKSLIALMGTQVIPQLSSDLRANVQREIISCRNAYIGRVDLGLKPMFINFNRLQKQFPNSLYNSLFFDWQTEELNMPKNSSGQEIFDSGEIKTLDLK